MNITVKINILDFILVRDLCFIPYQSVMMFKSIRIMFINTQNMISISDQL
jgi:hypothetical protein